MALLRNKPVYVWLGLALAAAVSAADFPNAIDRYQIILSSGQDRFFFQPRESSGEYLIGRAEPMREEIYQIRSEFAMVITVSDTVDLQGAGDVLIPIALLQRGLPSGRESGEATRQLIIQNRSGGDAATAATAISLLSVGTVLAVILIILAVQAMVYSVISP